MQEHATDPGVFIRSMASRGHLGGLSATTPQALRVLEAAGCDVILIETVGVGQSEVEVAAAADTTIVLLAPGMGDGIQAAKAGILEIADVLCVNKADRDGADTTMRELRHMIALGERSSSAWEVPVVKSVASTGVGIPELLDLLDKHLAWLTESGELITRRERRAAEEISALAIAALKRRLSAQEPELLADLAKAVVEGQLDPHAAAAQWVERLLA
jgi:LAO/AO transport system kinase